MISIVVPIYNGERYIDDCLRSILLQTYTDWELLLIDNASTDESLKLCKEYASKDERIQVLHQHRNIGVSVARNLGVEKARGEFVTFIDVDDWIAVDCLEHLMTVQKKENADMVICEYQKAYEKDRALLSSVHKKNVSNLKETAIGNTEKQTSQGEYSEVKIYEAEEYLEKYFLEGNTHCWGVLYERELLYETYFPKGMTIGEDMLFLLEVAQKASKVVVTDYRGYYYYINESGAMNKKFAPDYMDQIYCWEKALQKIGAAYPGLTAKVESILVVSVLLVVGKLSELNSEERSEYEKEEKECYETFLKYVQKKEIKKYLPAGYPLKVRMYRFFPKTYIRLYGKLRAR